LLGGGVGLARPPRAGRGGRTTWLWWLAGIPVGLLIALLLLIALFAGALEQRCASTPAGTDLAEGPGSLGGVAGTGLTQAQLEAVRHSAYASERRSTGEYVSTAYGPPWGGIQGEGVSTSGGVRLNRGAPHLYIVAVDPVLIGHGQLVYLWPNPFNWPGPFVAADTGGAIQQHRIDFYDWRGRSEQRAWGRRATTLTLAPRDASAPVRGAAVIGPGACGGQGEPGGGEGGALALPGTRGRVTVAALANAPGKPVRPELFAFLEGVAGIAGRELILTTGTNHSERTSSGNISDHVLGLAGDFGSVANGFPIGGGFGTTLAAAALRAAGLPARTALRIAAAGGGHNVCRNGRRVQVIWRTGGHYDHVHIGLRHGCDFTGVQTFQL
jgi:3D (Asp-Asp-Asp) domain-containing protein